MDGGDGRIEVLARGVCIKDGRILICLGKKAQNRYFPGGHIEFGEKGAYSLEREILEEIGVASVAREFLGCVEHSFIQNGCENHSEINLVYALDVPDLNPFEKVVAKEDWIAFEWMKIEDLPSSNVEPKVLRDKVLEWYDNREQAKNRLI